MGYFGSNDGQFKHPQGVAANATGTIVYVTDTDNNRIQAFVGYGHYILEYTADANGTISGTTPQTVSSGGSGTPVTAVADAGYNFVSWSDGVTTASRTDTNVTTDINVTASFAVNPFTLTYTASGTTPQTVNSGGSGTPVTAVASGEMRIATGDVDGDGRDNIVVGLGWIPDAPGISGGYFVVLDDNYAIMAIGQIEWPEYDTTNGETRPACGDIDGDGIAEIIIGLGPGSEGRMEIFKFENKQLKHVKWLQTGWEDYNRGNGEIRPACGDRGDGKDEVVAGLGPVMDNPDIPGGIFFIFDQTSVGSVDIADAGQSDTSAWGMVSWPEYNRFNGEIWPACGDVNADGKDEILLGLGKQGEGRFEILGFDLLQNSTRPIAWQQSLLSEGAAIHPACGNLESAAGDEIVIGYSRDGMAYMEIFGNAAEDFQSIRQVETHVQSSANQEVEIWPAVFRLNDK